MCAKSLPSCLTLCNPMEYSPRGSSVYRDSPDMDTGIDCHAVLHGIFSTQGSTHISSYIDRWALYHWCHLGSPRASIPANNFTSGYLLKENEQSNLKRYLDLHVHCSVMYNNQDGEAT